MAETTETWTIQGISVVELEAAEKMAVATPEEAERVAEIVRAGEKTPEEAVHEVIAKAPPE